MLSEWYISSTGNICRVVYSAIFHRRGVAILKGFEIKNYELKWLTLLPPDDG